MSRAKCSCKGACRRLMASAKRLAWTLVKGYMKGEARGK
jgi:hypothetical protein